MNYAIITAGGIGSRVNSSVPKQFIKIDGKPLIVYTLEKFQLSSMVDKIVVSCLDGWQSNLKEYIKKYKLSKVKKIVQGGENGQQSILNAYNSIKNECDSQSMIMVHDGNRPNVSESIIEEGFKLCEKKGNAIAYIQCQEVMFVTNDFNDSVRLIDRNKLARTQTPHVFKKHVIEKLFEFATRNELYGEPALCSLLQKSGMAVYLYKGDEKNIKVTYKSDFEIFKALLGVH